jgi:hypothetical protein
MAVIPRSVLQHIDIRWELSQFLPHRRAKPAALPVKFRPIAITAGGLTGPRETINELI